MRKVTLSKGDFLWEAGDVARNIAIVESGKLGVRSARGLVGLDVEQDGREAPGALLRVEVEGLAVRALVARDAGEDAPHDLVRSPSDDRLDCDVAAVLKLGLELEQVADLQA